MRVALFLLAGLFAPTLAPALLQVSAQIPGIPPANAPWYTPDTIVNTAADLPDWFAPNTFVAIFGANLAFTTRAIAPSDTVSGFLPTVLPGTNVRLIVNGLRAYMYYVSPVMINALLPASLGPGPTTLQLEVNGIAGPLVQINIRDVAPVVVTSDGTAVFGVHGDSTLITADAPAAPGETVFLFASGLGQTNPPLISGQIPVFAGQLKNLAGFSILLNGTALDPGLVSYAGILPGAAGTYELIVTLPAPLPHNPELRISVGASLSPPQTILATQ